MLAVVLCAALFIFVTVFDFNTLKPEIEQTVLEATGRRIRLEGDLRIELGAPPVISITDVLFANASWATRPDMVRIGELEIQIALLPLMSGTVDIRRISLIEPDIAIETNSTGAYNFELDLPDRSTHTSAAPRLKIDSIRIKNGTVTYADGQNGARFGIWLADLEAQYSSQTGLIEIESDGAFNDVPFKLEGESRWPFGQKSARVSVPIDLNLNLAGTKLSLNGKIEDIDKLGGIDVKLIAAGDSIPDLARLAGIKDLPDPGPFGLRALMRGSVSELAVSELNLVIGSQERLRAKIQGRIGNLIQVADVDLDFILSVEKIKRVEDIFNRSIPWKGRFQTSGRIQSKARGVYKLDGLNIQLADNRIAASLLVDRSGVQPLVTGELSLHRLNLRPFFQPGAFKQLSSKKATETAPVSSPAESPGPPLQAEDVLKQFDSRLTVRVGELLVPEVSFSQFTLKAILTEGQLQIDAQGPALPDIEELSGVTRLSDLGSFQLSGNLTAAGNTLSLDTVELAAGSRTEALVRVSGGIADLTVPRGMDFTLRIEGDDAVRLEKYLVQPWLLQGPYAVTGTMVNPDRSSLKFYDISGVLPDFGFKGSVDVDWSGTGTLVSVAVAAKRFNLKPLRLPEAKVPPVLKQAPDLGPLDAKVILSVSADKTGLQELNLRAGTANLAQLQVQGAAADLAQLQGAHFDISTSGNNMANLEQLTGQPLPVQGAFEAAARIELDGPQKFRFSGVKLTLAGSRVNADAALDVSSEVLKLTARIDSSEFDFRPLLIAPRETEPAFKKYVSETMAEDRRLLPEISLPSGWLAGSDIDVRIKARKVYFSNIQINQLNAGINTGNGRIIMKADSPTIALAGEAEVLQELSTIGAFNLVVEGQTTNQKLIVRTIQLDAGTPDTIEVRINGAAGEASGHADIDLNFSARGNDAAFLNRLLNKEFRITGPFTLSGHMQDLRVGEYQIEDLRLMIAESDVNGQLVIDLKSERPGIKAQFESRTLDLRPFLPEIHIEDRAPEPATNTRQTTAARQANERNVFSGKPFALEDLKLLDLSIALKAKELFARLAAMRDVDIDLSLQNGDLTVAPLRFTGGNGDIDGQITLQQGEKNSLLSARLDITNSDIGQVMDDLDRPREIEGPLDFHLHIEGPTDSMAGLMGGLNGTINLYVREGRVNNKYIGLLYGNLGTTMLNLIKPLSQKDPMINLNCFVLSFDIHDGKAKHAGLLDTKQTSLIAAGIIDLKNEQIDIALKSNPKGGFRIPGVGTIGMSLKELASPFKLGGSLANPSLAVDPTRSAATVGKLVGGFALLGPLGIAAALTDFRRQDRPPCDRALEVFEQGKKLGKEKDQSENHNQDPD